MTTRLARVERVERNRELTVLVQRPEVVDYQVEQTRSGITVRALAPTGVDAQALASELRDALTHAGVPAPEVTVAPVADLPRDPRTGKVRRFLPLR